MLQKYNMLYSISLKDSNLPSNKGRLFLILKCSRFQYKQCINVCWQIYCSIRSYPFKAVKQQNSYKVHLLILKTINRPLTILSFLFKTLLLFS